MTKKEFRQTKEWKVFSRNLRNKHGGKCELCYSKSNVGVHHLNEQDYENISNEDDFSVVCFTCHKRLHNLASSKRIVLEDYLDKIRQIITKMKGYK